MVDESGRYPCVEKVKAIMEKDYSKTDVTAVQSFIGMTLYYRNYIYDYANKVPPLDALTRKGVNLPDSWTEEHTKAVDILKEDLCSYPCLMNVDNTKPYQVRVDACREDMVSGVYCYNQTRRESGGQYHGGRGHYCLPKRSTHPRS